MSCISCNNSGNKNCLFYETCGNTFCETCNIHAEGCRECEKSVCISCINRLKLYPEYTCRNPNCYQDYLDKQK